MATSVNRKPLSNNETAYFTDDMLDDKIAIREFTFECDGERKTVISVRCQTSECSMEYEIYWGEHLLPIQVYRMVKDIADLYNKLMLDDFFDFLSDFLATEVIDNRSFDFSHEANKKMGEEVKSFFEKVEHHREA